MRADGAEQLVARLVAVLAERYGSDVTCVERLAPATAAMDSTIIFVTLAGDGLPDAWRRPLVLRVKPDTQRYEEGRREAAVHAWLAAVGYPVPQVFEVFAPGELGSLPVQAVDRAPGRSMLDAVARRPWRVREVLHRFAALHVQLHRLPVEGFPVGDDLLDRRLAFVRVTSRKIEDRALAEALDAVEPIAPRLRAAPPSVCHGDFHPLNVLLSGEDVAVIDWTDAGVGDRHGDVARTALLFELAAIAATGSIARRVLDRVGPRLRRTYLRAYRRQLALDHDRLALWTPVHLLHGWSQAVALHADATTAAGDHRAQRVPETMIGELRARFERALAVATA